MNKQDMSFLHKQYSMKKFIFSLVIPLALVLSAGTCKKETASSHFKIPFRNNSSKAVYAAWDGSYPDTIAFRFGNIVGFPQYYKVESGQTNVSALTTGSAGSFENILQYQISSRKIMIYVFDAAIIENTPIDTIKKNYMVLKRYDLTLEDLRAKNWIIEYP